MRSAVVLASCAFSSLLNAQLHLASSAGVLSRVTGEGVQQVREIVPDGVLVGWSAVSYDERKAVFIESSNKLGEAIYLSNGQPERLITDHEPRVLLLDMDAAVVTKACPLPKIPGMIYTEQWLADIPGGGLAVEWQLLNTNSLSDPLAPPAFRAMLLDAEVPCSDSFREADSHEVQYLAASRSSEGTVPGIQPWVNLDGDGRFSLSFNGAAETDFSYQIPKDMLTFLRGSKESFRQIMINDSHMLVTSLCSARREVCRFFALRKSDSTWHRVPAQEDSYEGSMRAFGSFVALTETHAKKAIKEQMAGNRGFMEINDDVRNREQSAGSSEWTKDTAEAFATASVVYPGRLHLYNIATEKLYTITTNQGDSEILLIEDNTVYYRVSNRLYSAPISENGIGTATLLATDEALRDAHLAFITH
jgi:hypothetical protein